VGQSDNFERGREREGERERTQRGERTERGHREERGTDRDREKERGDRENGIRTVYCGRIEPPKKREYNPNRCKRTTQPDTKTDIKTMPVTKTLIVVVSSKPNNVGTYRGGHCVGKWSVLLQQHFGGFVKLHQLHFPLLHHVVVAIFT
jgi:hypothetical protein